MFRFAWLNLLSRPGRSMLALVGLSIPVLGVVGLLSLSNGLRGLVGDTVKLVQGVMLLRTNTPSPVFSDLDPKIVPEIRAIPGIKHVAPEFWRIAPPVENTSVVLRSLTAKSNEKRLSNFLETPVVLGMDIAEHNRLDSAVYQRALLKPASLGGRFLEDRDRGQNRVVLSKKFAEQYPNADGTSRKPGDRLKIGSDDFEVIGIYETKSLLLDVVLVMDIDTARRLLKAPADAISSLYVEMNDPGENDRISKLIEDRWDAIDSRGMNEVEASFGNIMGQIDVLLMMAVGLAFGVGAIGIANTMIMSIMERVPEIGVLRTNGWSSRQILSLISLESLILGAISGFVGCLLAVLACWAANFWLTDGIQLVPTPGILGRGMVLAILTGMAAGSYPAWRASRWSPMEAIRYDP
jgi:putative ABC transport system permease protein